MSMSMDDTPLEPDDVPGIKGALLRYRVMAWIVGVLLVVLVMRPLYVYPANGWANFQDRKRLERWDRTVESGAFDERRRESKRWKDYSAEELRSKIVRDRMAAEILNAAAPRLTGTLEKLAADNGIPCKVQGLRASAAQK